MNKEQVMAAHDATTSKLSTGELEAMLVDSIIPQAVEQGATEIYPNRFVEYLKSEIDLDISAVFLGRALKNIGLIAKRGSSGSRYILPEKGDLEAWKLGIGL